MDIQKIKNLKMMCMRGSRNHLKDNTKEKDKKQMNKQKRYTSEYDIWWYFSELPFLGIIISRKNM